MPFARYNPAGSAQEITMNRQPLTLGDLRKMVEDKKYPDDMLVGYMDANGEGNFITCVRPIQGLKRYSDGMTFFVDPEKYEELEGDDGGDGGKCAWKIELHDPPILLISDCDISRPSA